MASQSLPVAAQARRQDLARASAHAPSLRAALIALVAIIILFRWLSLIVSLQIAATASQIQVYKDELARIERANAALEAAIAEASSPLSLAPRAQQIGYGPQTPAYVSSDEPLAPVSDSSMDLASLAERGPSAPGTPDPLQARSDLPSQLQSQSGP